MTQIAYLLLCHKDPARVIAQARRLLAMGDRVAIHFDARSSEADFDAIQTDLKDEPGVAFAETRHRCGWGEWSLVAASLSALRTARKAFPAATHFYLISGDCMPTKPAAYIRRRVAETGKDWIDAAPFETAEFIKTGFRQERLVYRHWFNERTQSKRFYAAYHMQRSLGLTRKTPAGLQMMVGSQWWCLRRATVDRLLEWLGKRPDVIRFFRTTWIPDECFFQTVVRHLVPEGEIEPGSPTFVKFSDYGQPVTFYGDHLPLLLAEDCLFARKIGADADELAQALGEHFASRDEPNGIGRNAARLHEFMTQQGRVGDRHGGRIWDTDRELSSDVTIVLVVCKKWHLGKRLVAQIARSLDALDSGYLFDEVSDHLPSLGGAEQGLGPRNAQRVVFVNALLAATGAKTVVLGCDPARGDVASDLGASGAEVSVLDLNCALSDDYLVGHAQRIGLYNDTLPKAMLDDILPTLRNQVSRERRELRQTRGLRVEVISETASDVQNARALADALGLDRDKAASLLTSSALFQD